MTDIYEATNVQDAKIWRAWFEDDGEECADEECGGSIRGAFDEATAIEKWNHREGGPER